MNLHQRDVAPFQPKQGVIPVALGGILKSQNEGAVQPKKRRGGAHAVVMALPAAMSLGVALGGNAVAQSVISTNQTSTVNLANYTPGLPVSVAAGTVITASSGAGLLGSSGDWTVSNAGTIAGEDGIGIYLGSGSLSNTGTITGSVDAIRLDDGGALNNEASGVISGSSYGVLVNQAAGSVANAGLITAGYNGVSLNHGGQVVNQASGTISGGHIGVYTGNGLGLVENSGLISAQTGDAVSLYTGGTFNNTASGRIIGGYSGVYAGGAGSSILNAGLITGPDFGAYLAGPQASLTNSGTITGGEDGVIGVAAGAVLNNAGVITGTLDGVRFTKSALVVNSGLITGGTVGAALGKAGFLSNTASGEIVGGGTGVQVANAAIIHNAGIIQGTTLAGLVLGGGDALTNAGSISGATGILVTGPDTSVSDTGVVTAISGGTAIELAGGADDLVLGTGAVITGAIDGDGSASQLVLQGTGTLGSDITGFGAGSALSVGQGADWTASGHWTVAEVTNAGTLQPGIAGAPLTLDGNFTQTASGMLRVVVTPTGAVPFTVNGAVQLGGALVYVLAPGAYTPESETFLTASGPVTGNFASTTAPSSAPADAAAAPVQSQTPVVVPQGSIVSHDPIAQELGHTQDVSLVVQQAFTVTPQDDALFADSAQASMLDAGRADSTVLGHADGAAAPCPAAAALPAGATEAGIAAAAAGAFCRAGGWVEASGSQMNANGAYASQGAGFLSGIGRPFGGSARLGIVLGYQSATFTGKTGGSARRSTLTAGLYGGATLGAFNLSATVLDGFESTSTTRVTGNGDAAARFGGNVLSAEAQASLPMQTGTLFLTPAAGVQFVRLSTGAFDETARSRAFALSGSASRATSLKPYLSLSVSRAFITASQLVVTPRARIGVMFGATTPLANVAAADDTMFHAAASRLDGPTRQLDLGVTAQRGRWALSLGYSAQAAGNWSAQSVEGAMTVSF